MGNVFTRSLQSAYQTKKPSSRFALMAESRNDALLLLTAFTSRAQKLCLRHKLSNFFWIAFQIGHGAAFGQRPAGPGLGSLNSSKWAHTAQSRFMVWRQCLFASSKPSPHQPECVFHLISRRGLVGGSKGQVQQFQTEPELDLGSHLPRASHRTTSETLLRTGPSSLWRSKGGPRDAQCAVPP